jgi:enamine deaminase RidA (YjgF/YER057c/UK114 family)
MLLLTAAAALFAAFTAAGAGGANDRRHLRLRDRTDTLPFSDAVIVDRTIYLAGKLGLDPATRRPPADAAAEARLVLDAVKKTLDESGATMDDLVSVQVFCSDLGHYETFNRVYASYFTKGQGHPARAFIGSGPLLFGARFEVQGIAVKR